MVDHGTTPNSTTNHVNVTRDLTGWEVRHERRSGEVRVVHYNDWHRVETALRTIEFDRMAPATSADEDAPRS